MISTPLINIPVELSGSVNSLTPFLLLGGRGNFLNIFCGAISPDLCSNNVKVCFPIPEDGVENVK